MTSRWCGKAMPRRRKGLSPVCSSGKSYSSALSAATKKAEVRIEVYGFARSMRLPPCAGRSTSVFAVARLPTGKASRRQRRLCPTRRPKHCPGAKGQRSGGFHRSRRRVPPVPGRGRLATIARERHSARAVCATHARSRGPTPHIQSGGHTCGRTSHRHGSPDQTNAERASARTDR